MKKPRIGISMGDPFGNGAEITVKALSDKAMYDRCQPLVIGDASCMAYAAEVASLRNHTNVKIHKVVSPNEAVYQFGTIDVLDLGLIQPTDIPVSASQLQPYNLGPTTIGGEAAFQYISKMIDLAMHRQLDATVTNAISKEAINMAGHHYSGHTEIFAEFTGTKKYAMMLAHDDLRVAHVSTHVSLRDACDRVKKDRVLEVIRLADHVCRDLGIDNPKIGVAGLNPHCGENGMFGREEIEEIQPAIDIALSENITIPDRAPTPPDTVFSKALGGWYDIVVVMYHDQGHIPLKIKGFVYNRTLQKWDAVQGVNITLGLPIIRTSVDHGTSYDHAGSGIASELSLVNAIDYAVRMAKVE